ncbi:MAG: PAS domain S-box protein, partial [Maioricimonas sp. JB049]
MRSRVTRLLIVEESAIDAEMLVMHLRRDGARIQWDRVETASGLHTALSSGNWDCVLCGGPDFSGELCLETVLEAVRQTVPHLPFLVVADSIPLERAVALMRGGVTDLITRDQSDRLPEMLARARDRREDSSPPRPGEPSSEAASWDALILGHIPDALIVLDAGGMVTRWNEGATCLLGWTPEEVVGRPGL